MGNEPRSFLCAPGLKIEAQERMTTLQFTQLQGQLGKIEQSRDRLGREAFDAEDVRQPREGSAFLCH